MLDPAKGSSSQCRGRHTDPGQPGSGRAASDEASETFDQAVFIDGRVEVALRP